MSKKPATEIGCGFFDQLDLQSLDIGSIVNVMRWGGEGDMGYSFEH